MKCQETELTKKKCQENIGSNSTVKAKYEDCCKTSMHIKDRTVRS